MITPTTDQLRQAAELLGYRICPDHTTDVGEQEFRLRALVTISALAQAHANSLAEVPDAQGIVDSTFHNVAAAADLIDCDDPLHLIRNGCCGLIREQQADAWAGIDPLLDATVFRTAQWVPPADTEEQR